MHYKHSAEGLILLFQNPKYIPLILIISFVLICVCEYFMKKNYASTLYKGIIEQEKEEEEKTSEDMYYEQTIRWRTYLEENGYNWQDDYDVEKVLPRAKEKIRLTQEYLTRNPKDIYIIAEKANLYSLLHNYELAKKDYEIVLKNYPKDERIIRQYASIIYGLNGVNHALEVLNSMYKDIPKGAEYYYSCSAIYRTDKNYNTAIEFITKAIELEPDNFFYYACRANLYKIIGNTEMYNSDNGMYNQLREKREKLLIEKYHNN